MIIHSGIGKNLLAKSDGKQSGKILQQHEMQFVVNAADVMATLLTLVNTFNALKTIALYETGSQTVAEFNLSQPEDGIILSTSGSKGERKWIFHPWRNLINRIHSLPAPQYNTAIFFSLAHAAGIESFFRHYLHDREAGFYSPSVSPALALQYLEAQNAQAISTTPSAFLRLISYPRLRLWIKQNVKLISLGGEEISAELLKILEKEFAQIEIQSTFGTTETWSVKTQKGKNLQWHVSTDPQVKMSAERDKLCIETPFLFTHYWNGKKFVEQTEKVWMTGDQVMTDESNYRFKKSVFRKYHGLKIFPSEWEIFLQQSFNLLWAQTKERDADTFVCLLPDEAKSQLPQIQQYVKDNGWPILHWVFQAAPEITIRGKLDHSDMPMLSGKELKVLLNEFPRSSGQHSFLEPFTWDDEAQFFVIKNTQAVLFYLDNPCRRMVQFLANNGDSLIEGLKQIKQEVLIKLPIELDLKLVGWRDLGKYHVWHLDLDTWRVPLGSKSPWGEYYPSLKEEFDSFLVGHEKIILSTLSDSMGFYGKDGKGEGLCAFRFIEQSYIGMYLMNRGLNFARFFQLCVQGLLLAREKSLKNAKTVVHADNPGAEFLHHALGFTKQQECYKVLSNKPL